LIDEVRAYAPWPEGFSDFKQQVRRAMWDRGGLVSIYRISVKKIEEVEDLTGSKLLVLLRPRRVTMRHAGRRTTPSQRRHMEMI
jgi:hypothetical protein